ncbi:PAQR family membrane homeostasis protein TrhA [Roseobacter sp. GAI101]|uniref:PAQR family membrane homeostasis protein TrhA n=1 Tax=Roseobacter sp. (strain GAI101) TaxID=391589 RepID=UPI0001872346|nr:hemolysin III family protein [Roseobacter sp. GAI101]EEB86320.1 hemolysin III [Roseobacter sp. GAI101]
MAYPYSPAETVADSTVHGLGLGFAIPGTFLLMDHAGVQGAPVIATLVYAICFILSLSASAIYHTLPFDRTRPLLQRVDHAAIYFKIAGTYTPIVMVIGTGFAYGILGIVWVLAIIGAVAKLLFWSAQSRASLALYLAMGWLSVLLIWPMWNTLPGVALVLIAVGGLTYSLGTIVYAHPGMRFQNAIWHGFVLAASICFFSAIAISL